VIRQGDELMFPVNCRTCHYNWIIWHGKIWHDTKPLCRHIAAYYRHLLTS